MHFLDILCQMQIFPLSKSFPSRGERDLRHKKLVLVFFCYWDDAQSFHRSPWHLSSLSCWQKVPLLCGLTFQFCSVSHWIVVYDTLETEVALQKTRLFLHYKKTSQQESFNFNEHSTLNILSCWSLLSCLMWPPPGFLFHFHHGVLHSI